jgi:hypothetical protein
MAPQNDDDDDVTTTKTTTTATAANAANPANAANAAANAADPPSAAAKQVAFLEQQAARVHLEAQALNKAGKFEEAKRAYAEMNAIERRALELAAAAATCASCEDETERQDALRASSPPEGRERRWPAHSLVPAPSSPEKQDAYASVLPAARFQGIEARRRAAASVCGAYVGDCASVGVQWIYDPSVLEGLLEKRRRREQEGDDAPFVGLEFLDPVASPFLSADYRTGRASPYGEETLVLIRALAAEAAEAAAEQQGDEQGGGWGLHCGRYAERYARAFAEGSGSEGAGAGAGEHGGAASAAGNFRGYMNASTRGFLRNYAASGLPPPWSGADDKQADCVARVAPLVAAFGGEGGRTAGDGAPRLSSSASASASSLQTTLLERAAEMATRVTQNDDEAVAWACAAALVLRRVVLGDRIEDAATVVASRLERWGAGREEEEREGEGEGEAPPPPPPLPMAPSVAAAIAAHVRDALARASDRPEQAAAVLGRNCHLPNSYQTPLQAALWGERAFESGELRGSSGGGGGERKEEAAAFCSAIRGALLGGGCCSSRAQAAGALLAARLGKGAIPASWIEKCWDWEEVEWAAGKIAGC